MTCHLRITLSCLALVLSACAQSDDQPLPGQSDTISTNRDSLLAAVAGTWNMRVMPEHSDSVLLTFELFAAPDTAGWTLRLGERTERTPVRVLAVEGDSIVTQTGPYPSALRPGLMVTTQGVWRLRGNELTGKTTAHYTEAGRDSVRVLRSEGTRAPK